MQDTSSTPDSALKIDPKIYWGYLLRYWYLVLIGLMVGGFYAYFQVRYTPPTYSTNSRMLVKDEYSSWGQEYFLPGMELVSSRNRLVNEVGIIKSYPLLHSVAQDLNWDISYFKLGNIKTTEMYPKSDFKVEVLGKQPIARTYYLRFQDSQHFQLADNLDTLGKMPVQTVGERIRMGNLELKIENVNANISLSDDYSVRFNSTGYWARHFQNNLRIDVENQESSILVLSENNTTPAKSIDFLNALMKGYIRFGVEQSNEIATNTVKFVDEQLRHIADSLVVTEHQMEKFYQKNFSERIFINDESSAGNNMQEVLDLETQLSQRSIQKEYYAALIRTLQSEEFTAFPSAAVFGFEDNNADQMTARIQKTVQEINERALQLKSNSEPIERMKTELQEQKNALISVAKNNQKQVGELMDSLRNVIRLEENKVLQIPAEQRKYLNIKRENKLLSDLYTFLLNKRSEASIAQASNLAKAQVLDYATAYRVKYLGPNAGNLFGISLFMGLVVPLGIILLFYLLNTKISHPSDLERISKLPLLGTVNFKKDLANNLVVSQHLKSVFAEAFRSIRTNLSFMTEGKEKVCVLVTSSISGEGKSFTSINLAAIYAASGKKTLLLGADMRKPKLYGDFALKNEVGLSTYLIQKASLEEIIQETKVKGLDLISAGPIPPNPAELLESKQMEKLMKTLKENYEVIIMDTPPLVLVTDCLLLKQHADAGLYIVRHDYTKKAHLQNINQLYEDKIIRKMGIVINAIKQPKGMAAYAYGNYGYGYGYGYGYYTES